jgi:hypothetical protein
MSEFPIPRATRAALYLRVSTNDQDTERQERELREVAASRGYKIVEVYQDHGISGAKGRDKRPAFDKLHKDAVRHRFDIVLALAKSDGQKTAGTLFRAAANMIAALCPATDPSGTTTRPPPGSRPRAMMAVSISASL